MKRKLIYLFIVLLAGGSILLQSCSETPIDNSITSDGKPGPVNLNPNKFYGVGNQYPQRCDPVSNTRVELWAGVGNGGGGTLVGYVEFPALNGDQLTVRYVMLNNGLYPWVIKGVHFQLSDKLNQIPVNNSGNPVPGQFTYKQDFQAPYTEDTITFTYTKPVDTNGDGYYVAAHASVCQLNSSTGTQGLCSILPDNIVSEIHVEHNYPTNYFNFHFHNSTAGWLQNFDLDGSGPLQPGNFYGYCLDADNPIYPPLEICGKFYCSSESLPPEVIGDGKVEHPENLPLINWILNNYNNGDNIAQFSYSLPLNQANWPFNGTFTSLGSNATITMGDIQCAIWSIIDNNVASTMWNDIGPWSLANPKGYIEGNVWAIIHDALTTSGASTFKPGCNQKMAVILVPTDCQTGIWDGKQLIMFYLPVPCGTGNCETAWGDGKFGARFPNANQWGTYFRWNVTCPTP